MSPINPSLGENDAIAAAKKCGGCDKECTKGCPVSIAIPDFVRAIAAGDLERAADLMYEQNPFPCITGRLCSSGCESACPKGVPIRALERFIGDNFLPQLKTKKKAKHKVAVVGTGIAGLVLANQLLEKGHHVSMLEMTQAPGGFLRQVPDFRLPKAVLKAELDRVLPHVETAFDCAVGTMHPIEELCKGYDAVVIASGAAKPVFGVRGEHLRNVFSPHEYQHLTRNGLHQAVVIGSDNHALESAIIARQRGSDAVVVHEEDLDTMDVDHELLRHAMNEGVQFLLLTKPLGIHGEGGVDSIECQQMRVSEEYAGFRETVPIEESEFRTECDHVVIAKGYEPHPHIAIHSSLRQAGKHKLWTNSKGQTTIPNVFAAGGSVIGAKHVEEIIAHAKDVALKVDAFLTEDTSPAKDDK